MSKDLYTLAAIAALESGSPQGQADVAQSVYNRVQDKTYGSSITDVLTRKQQYQPAFIDPNASEGPGTAVSPKFKAIVDENSAVAAMSSYYRKRNITKSESSIRQQLKGSISAIQDPTYQQNARNFVGNRTEFLSPNQRQSGDIWRGTNNDNAFFIAYGSPKNQAGQNPTASVPTVISESDQTIQPDPPQEETTQEETVEFNLNLLNSSPCVENSFNCKNSESITTGQTIIQADPCKDNTFARVESYLTNFFDRVTQVGNAVFNLTNEINFVVELIGDTVNGFVNKMLGSLSDVLSGLVNKGINTLTSFLISIGRTIPEIILIETPLIPLVKVLFDGLFCAATKVMEGAKDAMKDLISSSIKNVLNAGSCVVEQIMGAFTNNLVNIVDSIAGPLLNPISNILNSFGGLFFNFNVKDFLLTGINAVRKIANLFQCNEEKICPASSKYVIDTGLFKDMSEDEENSAFNKIFSGTAISQGSANLVGDFEEKYGKWTVFGAPLSEASNLGPCDFGNVSECGLPTVSFFGGDGLGATGSVILGNIINNVDTEDAVGSVVKVGSIVGVEMTNPGQSYTRAPLVTFQDSCNKGYGGYGRAIIDQNISSPTYGQVTSVVITSEGENYPSNIAELPLYIIDVIIENPGQNYQDNDTVQIPDIEKPIVDIEIVDGRVTRVDVKEEFAFNGLPDLNIESSTGFGAVLRPIMSIVQPDRQDGQDQIIQVIDCVS